MWSRPEIGRVHPRWRSLLGTPWLRHGVLAALAAGSTLRDSAVNAQTPVSARDRAALDSALFRHATAVLEREGTTFYALGAYLDSTGKVLQFTPERWPNLNAPPAAWEDSLRWMGRPEAMYDW